MKTIKIKPSKSHPIIYLSPFFWIISLITFYYSIIYFDNVELHDQLFFVGIVSFFIGAITFSKGYKSNR